LKVRGSISMNTSASRESIAWLPSVEPESTTTISGAAANRCRRIASMTVVNRDPPFRVGMTIETGGSLTMRARPAPRTSSATGIDAPTRAHRRRST
jgi:hypothetical protein